MIDCWREKLASCPILVHAEAATEQNTSRLKMSISYIHWRLFHFHIVNPFPEGAGLQSVFDLPHFALENVSYNSHHARLHPEFRILHMYYILYKDKAH